MSPNSSVMRGEKWMKFTLSLAWLLQQGSVLVKATEIWTPTAVAN